MEKVNDSEERLELDEEIPDLENGSSIDRLPLKNCAEIGAGAGMFIGGGLGIAAPILAATIGTDYFMQTQGVNGGYRAFYDVMAAAYSSGIMSMCYPLFMYPGMFLGMAAGYACGATAHVFKSGALESLVLIKKVSKLRDNPF